MTENQTPKLSTKTKKKNMGRKPKYIEEADIIEALRASQGFIMRARDYLEYKKGVVISHTLLANRIAVTPALQSVVIEERTKKAEDVLEKHVDMAKEGKSMHIINVLEHWGHLVGYERQQPGTDQVRKDTIESAYNQMESD